MLPTIINLKKRFKIKVNNKPSQNSNQDTRTLRNKITPSIKSPAKPPFHLIEKPKNLANNFQSNQSAKNKYNSGGKTQILSHLIKIRANLNQKILITEI